MSTIVVEHIFSFRGKILDEKQSTLSPHPLETQALIDDWMKAAKTIQEIQLSNDEVEEFDIKGTTTMETENRSH